MAALTHLGIGLASKKVIPHVNVGFLILCAYLIDLIWGLFFALKIETLTGPDSPTVNHWSHGLFMAVVWTLVSGLIVYAITRKRKTAILLASLVFSHWAIDFVSHPMTHVFEGAVGLPLLLADLPRVGLGLWRSATIVNIGEYGILLLGFAIYLRYRLKKRAAQKAG